MFKISSLFFLVSCLFFWPASAWANTAVAEVLFEDGRRLFEEEKYEEACAKFAESQRIDPGTGTLLNLANCYEKAGRLASAWATWLEAETSARSLGQTDREEHARTQADTLKSKLATITVAVLIDARPEGFVITKNGEEQHAAVWGTAVPVDAGTYRFEARAPGYRPWASEITIVDGQTLTVTVPALSADEEEPTSAAVLAPAQAAEPPEAQDVPRPASEPIDSEEASSGLSRKTWGTLIGGAGLVGLTVGGIFGIKAINRNNRSYDNCHEVYTELCDEEGANLRWEAQDAALISTIFMGVGAAAVATGVILVVFAPKSSTEMGASVGPSRASLFVKGSF